MLKRLRFLRRLAVDLPKQARLAYCLMRDPRVPRRVKLAFGAALAVIATPVIDIPASLPVVGEIDMLALSMLAMRLFIGACPDDVVADVQQHILEGSSVFDEDLRRGERIATAIASRFDREAPTNHNNTGLDAGATAPARGDLAAGVGL